MQMLIRSLLTAFNAYNDKRTNEVMDQSECIISVSLKCALI